MHKMMSQKHNFFIVCAQSNTSTSRHILQWNNGSFTHVTQWHKVYLLSSHWKAILLKFILEHLKFMVLLIYGQSQAVMITFISFQCSRKNVHARWYALQENSQHKEDIKQIINSENTIDNEDCDTKSIERSRINVVETPMNTQQDDLEFMDSHPGKQFF